MVKVGTPISIYAGLFALVAVVGVLFVITGKFGALFKKPFQSQVEETLNNANRAKYDIRRIKYEGRDGSSIEILQNGTIVSIDESGKKQAVLGFSKLEALFGHLTEEDLMRLQNQGGSGATLTIETKSGAIYIIHSDGNGDSDVDELIDEIVDTEDDTFNPPTPMPTPYSASTPLPTGQLPSPQPTGQATPSPTPLSVETTPTPLPSLPPFVGPEPFDCSDYILTKNATISNIICEPNQ